MILMPLAIATSGVVPISRSGTWTGAQDEDWDFPVYTATNPMAWNGQNQQPEMLLESGFVQTSETFTRDNQSSSTYYHVTRYLLVPTMYDDGSPLTVSAQGATFTISGRPASTGVKQTICVEQHSGSSFPNLTASRVNTLLSSHVLAERATHTNTSYATFSGTLSLDGSLYTTIYLIGESRANLPDSLYPPGFDPPAGLDNAYRGSRIRNWSFSIP